MIKLQNLRKKITGYNVFLGLSFLLVFFSILAPISLHFGFTSLSKAIYFVYSFFCHQIHYRSLHIFDYQFAWCTRDTFIWTGLFVAGSLVKKFKIKPIKWYFVVLAALPMAFDGGVQLLATMLSMSNESDLFYASTNFSRMVTGSILGIGLALWIFPMLQEIEMDTKIEKIFSQVKIFFLAFFISFVFYIILIGLWSITSTNYKPANIIDWKNRFPDTSDEWLVRRKHAICPINADEGGGFLSFRCDEQ